MSTLEVAPRPTLRRCGDSGWLLDLGDNAAVHVWAAAIREASFEGVIEIVPGLTSLLVAVNPNVTTLASLRAGILDLQPSGRGARAGASHVIDVHYDGEDLSAVAGFTGLPERDVVLAHTGSPWRVAFCGFAPGFAYLVGGDPRLRVPRRDEARVRVPAGAVAIAGEFAAIYPRVSPGGWQLLGHTDTRLWDSSSLSPAVLLPGDIVVFRDIDAP